MEFSVDEHRMLGSGYFGRVYLGKLGSQAVAAKTRKESSSTFKEARLLKQCKHENVIKGLGVFAFSGKSYLVMELAEGGCLRDHLGRKKFSMDWKTLLVRQICRGLEHIHRKQIVHRNIEVANLLLKRIVPPLVVIGDFGMAKTFYESSREANHHDIVLDRRFTHKSDVYLLALVTWQIFEDVAFANRVSLALNVLERGLDENIFTEITWQSAIVNSLDGNPDARPTVREFRLAFS